MSTSLLQKQLTLLSGSSPSTITKTTKGKSRSGRTTQKKEPSTKKESFLLTESLTHRQKKKLLRSRKSSASKFSAKTGHETTDAKAKSLAKRKELLLQAQKDAAQRITNDLSKDEKAMMRFRETSMSLLAYQAEVAKNDYTDDNIRLLLCSEAFSHKSDRARVNKPLIDRAIPGAESNNLDQLE